MADNSTPPPQALHCRPPPVGCWTGVPHAPRPSVWGLGAQLALCRHIEYHIVHFWGFCAPCFATVPLRSMVYVGGSHASASTRAHSTPAL
jgi:hypothetical protein